MPKNLVLCSDGTGNSGSKALGTNVWRIYEAVAKVAPTQQETYYDDGVGTDDFKLLKILGGAFGIGLERNVIQAYSFLIRRFEPGDKIFLFGFSRGAFTVRVLANLLLYCGIPKRVDANGQELNRQEVERIAKEGVRLYGNRPFHNPDAPLFKKFRENFGLRDGRNVAHEPGWFPIHFIGVWDTVEAYGLPFDELSDALSWFFPLRLQEQDTLRENDLHPLIENGYHGLAIDDERHTFHPKLWIENGDQRVMTFGQTLDSLEPPRTPKVEQVWFAGMHTNVGGGYNQDHLAHVSLMWMIDKAAACGLRFDTSLVNQYNQLANPHGRMYDSRAGLACYYRYRPRDLGVLCRDGGLAKPTLHKSVLERIQHRTNEYAPTGIPESYDVTPPLQLPQNQHLVEARRTERFNHQKIVDDQIWIGRAHYFVFLIWTIALAAVGWALSGQAIPPDTEVWSWPLRTLRDALKPLWNLAAWLTPSYFEPGIHALSHRPDWVAGFGVALIAVLWKSHQLNSKIRHETTRAWLIGFGRLNPHGVTNTRLSNFRHQSSKFADWFYHRIVPWAAVVLLAFLGIVFLWRWLSPVLNSSISPRVTTNEFAKKKRDKEQNQEEEQRVSKFRFKTSSPLQPLPVIAVAGKRYRVTVKPIEQHPWKDNDHPANPEGIMDEESLTMTALRLARRVGDENWFHVMISVGPDCEELHSIGSQETFLANSSGRLYIFVNDAYFFYWNNSGEAEVTVEKLD